MLLIWPRKEKCVQLRWTDSATKGIYMHLNSCENYSVDIKSRRIQSYMYLNRVITWYHEICRSTERYDKDIGFRPSNWGSNCRATSLCHRPLAVKPTEHLLSIIYIALHVLYFIFLAYGLLHIFTELQCDECYWNWKDYMYIKVRCTLGSQHLFLMR